LSKRCAQDLREALGAPPDIRLRVGEGLTLPLRVLPLAYRCAVAAAASVLGVAAQLVMRGQVLLAVFVLAVLVIAGAVLRRDLLLRGPGAPFRLRLSRDGTLWVYCRNGRVEQVRVRPQSLRMAGGLLLVLQGTRTYRLWLASGNTEPGTLAALHRCLGRGAAAPPGLR
jgi:hypothetical protein